MEFDQHYLIVVHTCNRNRAIQGDSVVIELLPHSQWKGRSKALPVPDSSHDQSCDSLVPSGRVVAITDRRVTDIVATFPVNQMSMYIHICVCYGAVLYRKTMCQPLVGRRSECWLYHMIERCQRLESVPV